MAYRDARTHLKTQRPYVFIKKIASYFKQKPGDVRATTQRGGVGGGSRRGQNEESQNDEEDEDDDDDDDLFVGRCDIDDDMALILCISIVFASCDRPTDRPTDTVAYRDARTHLKTRN